MKRISVLLVILVTLGLIFVSCSQPLPPPSALEPTPVPTPAPTEEPATPTPPETPTPELPPVSITKIEVEWKSIKLPGAEYTRSISVDDNKGDIVYCVATKSTSKLFPLFVWKTENGGHSWQLVGELSEVSFKDKEAIAEWCWTSYAFGFPVEPDLEPPVECDLEPLGEGYIPRYKINLFPGEKVPEHNYPIMEVKRVAPNNEEVILQPIVLDPGGTRMTDEDTHPCNNWRLLLSGDGGQSWFEIDLPPPFAPQTTEMRNILITKYDFDLAYHQGKVKIFFSGISEVWKTEINLPK